MTTWLSVRAITLSLKSPYTPQKASTGHMACTSTHKLPFLLLFQPGNTSMSINLLTFFIHVSVLPLYPGLMLHPSFHFRPISHNHKYFPKHSSLLLLRVYLCLRSVSHIPLRHLAPALPTRNGITSFGVLC